MFRYTQCRNRTVINEVTFRQQTLGDLRRVRCWAGRPKEEGRRLPRERWWMVWSREAFLRVTPLFKSHISVYRCMSSGKLSSSLSRSFFISEKGVIVFTCKGVPPKDQYLAHCKQADSGGFKNSPLPTEVKRGGSNHYTVCKQLSLSLWVLWWEVCMHRCLGEIGGQVGASPSRDTWGTPPGPSGTNTTWQ